MRIGPVSKPGHGEEGSWSLGIKCLIDGQPSANLFFLQHTFTTRNYNPWTNDFSSNVDFTSNQQVSNKYL